jgi:adenylosuccinate synthase
LDLNYGDYPYVTSSETLPYSACSLGFSPKKIRDIIGVAKIYDTKSGVDPLFPETLWQDDELNMLIEIGQEFGSTTGRKRIVNWLNLNKLIDAVKISGVTKLIINKCDVLDQIHTYKLYQNNSLYKFNTLQAMQSFIKSYISSNVNDYVEIVFSGNKSTI